MVERASNSTPTAAPKRKRSLWERAVVWIGILVLLAVVFVEWKSRDGYSTTLADLEDALAKSKSIPLNDIDRHLHGFVKKGEKTKAGIRTITLHWPSLFKKYSLGLPVTVSDEIKVVDTELDSGFDTPIVSKSSAPESRGPKFPGGPIEPNRPLVKFEGRMPAGYEHVVALKLNENRSENDLKGVLSREIIRQAILIAAEEELGLVTLDPSIGETIPEGKGDTGPVTILFSAPQLPTGKISSTGMPIIQFGVSVVLHHQTPAGHFNWHAPEINLPLEEGMEILVERAEAYSREQFVEGLKKIGFDAAKKNEAPATDLALPPNEMDIVSQLTRIRLLHQQLAARGESAAILGQLVCAYANLGNMTDYLWGPISKAYKARSLIYAQRLVAKHGSSPFTLAHRAYAQALAGRHAPAAEAVRAAKATTGVAAPDWLDLISDYCDYKPDSMTADTENAHLASYLKLRMSDLNDDETGAVKAVQQVLEENPACCRAAECLSETHTLGLQRLGAELGLGPVWTSLCSRLAEMPDLPTKPQSTAKLLADSTSLTPQEVVQRRLELIVQLEQPGERKTQLGPAWSALAGMLRDTAMVQLWRLVDFELNTLGTSTLETLELYGPLIQGHRHEKFVRSFTDDGQERAMMLSIYLDPLKKKVYDVNMLPVYAQLSGEPNSEEGPRFLQGYLASTDPLLEDVLRQSGYQDMQKHPVYQVSPRWPAIVALAISNDLQMPFEECEKQYEKSATVLLALYRHYYNLKMYDDALRCANKIVALAPTYKGYRALAAVLKEQKKTDEWRQAMLRATEFPTFGLETASIHHELAEEAFERQDWQAAKPHALEAAASYSGWGLMSAAYVMERLEDWKEAEKFVRACSERYEDSSANWYFWCVRTGRGDLKKAKKFATNHWATTIRSSEDPSLQWELVTARILDGNLAEAIVRLKKIQDRGDTNAATLAAVLADKIGETQKRDQIFSELESKWQPNTGFVELTNLFRGVLSGKPECRWNRNTFDHIVLNANPDVVADMYFQAATFLENHNEPELAEEYMKCAAASGPAQYSSFMAVNALRTAKTAVPKRGITVLPDALAEMSSRLDKVAAAWKTRKFDEADLMLDELVQLRPEFPLVYVIRGAYRERRRNFVLAAEDYEKATKLDPNYACAQLKLSWLLSTCDDKSVRDGKRALKLAESAKLLRQFDTAVNESVLAAAYAECGDFEKATLCETRAKDLPGKDGAHQNRLEAYQRKAVYGDSPNADFNPVLSK